MYLELFPQAIGMLFIHLKNTCIENLLSCGTIQGIAILLVNRPGWAVAVPVELRSNDSGREGSSTLYSSQPALEEEGYSSCASGDVEVALRHEALGNEPLLWGRLRGLTCPAIVRCLLLYKKRRKSPETIERYLIFAVLVNYECLLDAHKG